MRPSKVTLSKYSSPGLVRLADIPIGCFFTGTMCGYTGLWMIAYDFAIYVADASKTWDRRQDINITGFTPVDVEIKTTPQ